MIVVMTPEATSGDIEGAKKALKPHCRQVHVSRGADITVLGLISITSEPDIIEAVASRLRGVERTERISHPYKLVAARADRSTVYIGEIPFGPGTFGVIAGPCAIDTKENLLNVARRVQAAGAAVLRGDHHKARTSPYENEGLGEEALQIQAEVKQITGMPFVVDVLSVEDVELALAYGADCLRVGTRYMYTAHLLEALGRQQQATIMIKRGFSATLTEWLLAAERVAMNGNSSIILVERGVRSFGTETRNLLDIMAVPVLQRRLTCLPVLVDPSHSTGDRDLVPDATRAALGVKAAGVIVDVHPSPEDAFVDGRQALLPEEFAALMEVDVKPLLGPLGLKLS